MPSGYDELSLFQKMLILKTFREEKIALCVTRFVADTMGDKFA